MPIVWMPSCGPANKTLNPETGAGAVPVWLTVLGVRAGPVCTIKLPHLIPIGLHGSWTGEYLGPALPEPFPTDWQPTINTIK